MLVALSAAARLRGGAAATLALQHATEPPHAAAGSSQPRSGSDAGSSSAHALREKAHQHTSLQLRPQQGKRQRKQQVRPQQRRRQQQQKQKPNRLVPLAPHPPRNLAPPLTPSQLQKLVMQAHTLLSGAAGVPSPHKATRAGQPLRQRQQQQQAQQQQQQQQPLQQQAQQQQVPQQAPLQAAPTTPPQLPPPLGEELGAWLSGGGIGEDYEPISPHIHVTEADRARQRAGWLAETLVPMQREGANASAPLEPHPIYGKREPKRLWAPPPSPPPERDDDGLGERGFNPTVGKVPLVLNGP